MKHHLINNRAAFTFVALIATLSFSSIVHGGGLLYVDDDAPPGGDGRSWDSAYRFLAEALVAAWMDQGGEIRVAQGVYQPDRDESNPDGTGDREATFQLINDLALMGGYAGIGAKDPDARDIELYETILSGDLLGNDGPGFENNEENSLHVVRGYAIDETTVLDGFVITAGNADGLDDQVFGGGMFNSISACPTVANCTFRGNLANEYGGGMYNWASAVNIVNCTFAGNRALGGFSPGAGGAMYNRNSNPTLINCAFSSNGANLGSAMSNTESSDPMLINCTISGDIFGTAMYNVQLSSPTLINCIVWDNAGGFGGNASPIVTYSNIEGGYEGVGNIDADPLFLDPANGDYRLSAGSPCIDAGNNWGVSVDVNDYDQDGITNELFPVDLDGNPRFNADENDFDPGCGVPVVVDMGAYEYQFDPVENVIFADLNGDGTVGAADLLGLLADWGPCAKGCCLADLDLDGVVGASDLLALLANWG